MKKVKLKKTKKRLVKGVSKRSGRRLGILRGRIKFRRGWDKPLPADILAYFEGRK